VLFSEGCHLYKDKTSGLAMQDNRVSEACIATKEADAVVIVLGLNADIEGEQGDTGNEFASGDKFNLMLPGRQNFLLEKVVEAANGKPVILVNITGSAINLSYADEHVGGIIQAFYPGALGGRAIAEIIAGKVNPAGKLPVTFYRSCDDLPEFWNYSMEGRTYRYFRGEALYPFGFGLSYTTYSLDTLKAEANKVSIRVKNTGKKAGHEVVQVYVESPNQKERYRLVGTANVQLSANKAKTVEVTLVEDAFSRRDWKGDFYKLPGKHILHVGLCQPDSRSIKLYGAAPLTAEIEIHE